MSAHRRDRHRRARSRGRATGCAGSCRGRHARRGRRCHTPRSRRCCRSRRLRPTPAGPSCRSENERAGRYRPAAPPDPAREGAFQPPALAVGWQWTGHLTFVRGWSGHSLGRSDRSAARSSEVLPNVPSVLFPSVYRDPEPERRDDPTSGWPAPTCGLARTRTRTDGSLAAARPSDFRGKRDGGTPCARQVGLPPARARASVSWPEPSGGPPHSRLVRRSSFLSDAGLRRSTVRRMPTKSNAATGQWNQILCRPVKTLIRIRKPEIVRAAARGRGRFANQSETRVHGEGSYPSLIRRAPASDAATPSARGGGLSSAGKLRPPAAWPPVVTR